MNNCKSYGIFCMADNFFQIYARFIKVNGLVEPLWRRTQPLNRT